MSSTELAERVVGLLEEVDKLDDELDALIAEARGDISAEAVAWIEAEVKQRVEDHAKAVLTLGFESVREMKGRVSDLLDRVPELVESETNDPDRWPHREGKRVFFAACFRNVIAHLGGILDDFGMTGNTHGREASPWESSDRRGPWRYTANTGFEEQSQQSIRRYWEALEHRGYLSRELEEVSADLERARASELWDSA